MNDRTYKMVHLPPC